jgi:hypothetical protein
MNRLLLVLLTALPLAACAPTSGAMVPATGPLLYAAEPDDVFASVMHIITTAEGLENSNGWIISETDSEAGYLRVDTTVLTPWRFWAPQRVETLSVAVSAGRARTDPGRHPAHRRRPRARGAPARHARRRPPAPLIAVPSGSASIALSTTSSARCRWPSVEGSKPGRRRPLRGSGHEDVADRARHHRVGGRSTGRPFHVARRRTPSTNDRTATTRNATNVRG